METTKNTQWTVAEIQLVYKSKVKVQDRPKITSTTDAYTVLKKAWDDYAIDLYEQFKVMYLDRGNRVVGIYNISSGGVNSTVVDPKLIYAAALKIKTSNIILAHNHPSGTLVPSEEDKKLTKKLKEGAQLLDIRVLDHIIITSESYISFADSGLMD